MFDYALFIKSAVLILEVCSCVYNRKMLLNYLKTQHKSLYSLTSLTASSSSPLYVNSMCGLWCHQKLTWDHLVGQLKHFTILIMVLKIKHCAGSASQKVGWQTFLYSVMGAVGLLGRSKQVLSCTGSASQKVGWRTFPYSIMGAVGPLGRSKQVLSCHYQLWDQ
jgi:hypothetical protein